MRVIIDLDSKSAVGYRDVYGDDEWIKIQGCEGCKDKKKCCQGCEDSMPNGDCAVHEKGKPLNCIIAPSIKMCVAHCQLEYQCIKGINKGKIRRVKDKLNVLV